MEYALKIRDEDTRKDACRGIIVYVLEMAADESRIAQMKSFVERLPETERFIYELRIDLQLDLGTEAYHEFAKDPEEGLRRRLKGLLES